MGKLIAQQQKVQQEIRLIDITLAFAPSPTQHLYKSIQIEQGIVLYEALKLVGWLRDYPELARWCEQHKHLTDINKKAWWVGIYSDKKLLSYELQDQDRIEIYRPLTIDPKNRRKIKATA